jgi:hypothetical protein
MHTDDTYTVRVRPHVLRNGAEVAVATVDGVATVGLFGLDEGGGLDVISVETVGLVLTRDHD